MKKFLCLILAVSLLVPMVESIGTLRVKAETTGEGSVAENTNSEENVKDTSYPMVPLGIDMAEEKAKAKKKALEAQAKAKAELPAPPTEAELAKERAEQKAERDAANAKYREEMEAARIAYKEAYDAEEAKCVDLQNHVPNEDMSLEAYAFLYSDGTLIFQRGSDNSESVALHGEAVYSRAGIENLYNTRVVPSGNGHPGVQRCIFLDKITPNYVSWWFKDMQTLSCVFGCNNVDTSKVGDASYLFSGCNTLKWVDTSTWRFPVCSYMSDMFFACQSLEFLDISEWGCKNIKDLAEFVRGNFLGQDKSNIEFLDFSSWDLSAVTTTDEMCEDCSKLKYVNIGDSKLSNLRVSSYMFSRSGLVSVEGDWGELNSLNKMHNMFNGSAHFMYIDSSNWELRNVKDMSKAFSGCSSLENIDVSKWVLGLVESMESCFQEDRKLVNLNFNSISESSFLNLKNIKACFSSCNKLKGIYSKSDWNLPNCSDISSLFDNCLSVLVVPTLCNLYNVEYADGLFRQAKVKYIDSSKWYLKNIKVLGSNNSVISGAFCNSNVVYVDMSSWDLSLLTNMKYCFRGSKLTYLDFSECTFGQQKLNCSDAFYDSSLEYVDIGEMPIYYGANLFLSSKNLKFIDMSHIPANGINNLNSFLQNCPNILVCKFPDYTVNIENLNYLFGGTCYLKCLDISNLATDSTSGNQVFNWNNIDYIIIGSKLKNSTGDFNGEDKWAYLKTGEIMTHNIFSRRVNSGLEEYSGAYAKIKDITFHANGGSTEQQTIQSYLTAKMPALKPATKEGYTFLGWSPTKDGKTLVKEGDEVTSSDYYAIYKENNYKLILKSNDGTSQEESHTLKYTEEFKLPKDIFSSDDYDLLSWNTKKDGTGTEYKLGELVSELNGEDNGETVLYAQWKGKVGKVVISFDSDGGTPVRDIVLGDVNITYSYSVTEFPVPIKPGYYFEGWGVPEGTSMQPIVEKRGYGNKISETDSLLYCPMYIDIYSDYIINFDTRDSMTLKAFWRKIDSVTLDKNDGSHTLDKFEFNYKIIPRVNPVSGDRIDLSKFDAKQENGYVLYTKANAYIPVNDYDRTLPSYEVEHGKKFLGWYDHRTIDESEINNGLQKPSLDMIGKTYYGGWAYTLEFDCNYGTIENEYTVPISLNKDYIVENLPDCTRKSYEFLGWYIEDTKVEVGTSLDLSKNYKLTARWKQVKNWYNVEFNSGSHHRDIKVLEGEKLKSLPGATKLSNKLFVNWTDEEDNVVTEDTVVTRDMVITANYIDCNCIVTFDYQGGTSYYYITKNVPSGYSLGTLPGGKKSGYVLGGWYSEPNGQGMKLTKDTKISESCTYYANWVDYLHEDNVGNAKYVYGAEWSNASNSHVDNYENRLEWHPTSASTYTSSLHIRFEVDRTVESEVLPLGSVKIRIPKYIWKNIDGNYVGTNNLSANLPKYVEGKIETGRMVFSYYEDGDDYVLINNRDLSGGAGVDLTVSYSLNSSDVRTVAGGATDSNNKYVEGYKYYDGEVPIVYEVDKDLDSVVDSSHKIVLYNEIHTRCSHTFNKSANSNTCGVYQKWLPSWGAAPEDSEDYIYLRWYLNRGVGGYTQNSVINMYDDYVSVGEICSTSLENVTYPITKIKKTELQDIPPEGIKVTNYAHSEQIWDSGYKTMLTSSADMVIYNAKYPEGEFTKDNTYTYVKSLSGAQDDLVDGKKVSMTYKCTYRGDTFVSHPNSEIRIKDGKRGDLIYSSGDCSAKYVWEPETKNITLSDDDYSFYSIYVTPRFYKSVDIGNYDNGTYENDLPWSADVYVRYSDKEDFEYLKTTTSNVGITLPEDVVGYEVRLRHTGYLVDLRVTATLQLQPTNRLKRLVKSDMQKGATSIIKNVATCDIYSEDNPDTPYFHVEDRGTGDDPANKQIYELTKSNTTQVTKKDTGDQNAVIFDVNEGVQDDPICIGSWNYNNGNRKKRMSSGVFYDLLPSGTTVDKDTIYGVNITTNRTSSSYLNGNNYNKDGSGHLNPAYYDVEMIENWEGSERTMMKIAYSLPDSMESTGMEFYYLLHNTYENVIARGTTRDNELAFVNTSEEREKPYSKTSAMSVLTAPDLFKSLDAKYTDYISYAKDATHYIPVDAFSWKFDKMVQTNSGYATRGIVLLNSGYDYRLSYTQSDYATGKDIIFYDVLEHEAQLEDEDGNLQTYQSDWNGIFNYVDLSSLKLLPSNGDASVTCAPVVWYSTKPKESFMGSAYDLSNSEIWSTEMPEDKSTITAVAVDCRKASDGSDFVLKGFHAAECFIHMTSPKNVEYDGKSAYNEGFVSVRKDEDVNPTSEYSGTKVTIHDATPELHKSSVGNKDTSLFPALVHEDDEIAYELRVDNTSDYRIDNTVVTDTLVEGSRFNSKDLKVKFTGGDYVDLQSCPRIRYAKEGRTLRFIVNSLAGGESCTIKIPVQVSINDGILLNHAEIPEVNGVAKEIVSEMTQHKVIPTGLSVLKTNSQGEPLEGATLQLTDSEGTLIEEWVSSKEPKYFEVRPGTYYVKEVSVPDKHFGISEPVKAVLFRNGDLEGSLNYVNVENVGTRVKISKKDPDGKFLGGAELKVYRAEDFIGGKPKDGAKPVLEFTSQGKEVLYEGILDKGAKYVLYEETAPEGYRKAAPVEFTVPETPDEVSIEMVDKPKGANGDIIVEKHVEGTGGDKTREFEFTLTLDNDSLSEFILVDDEGNANVVGAMKSEGKSSCTFKLSDGKKMRIQGIPNGMGYSIVENVSGYRSDIVNGSGVVNFDDSDTCNVLCTNIKNIGIPTGEDCLCWLIWLSLLSILGYVWYIWNRRKHKRILLGYEEE